jgi:hypothetical protein
MARTSMKPRSAQGNPERGRGREELFVCQGVASWWVKTEELGWRVSAGRLLWLEDEES